MGKKIEIRISGKAYPSLIAACEDNGINPVNVRDYASAHGISEQKAFMVYLASPNGKLGKKAREWTAEEDKLLRQMAGNRSDADISKKLGRSVLAIRKRATVIGISLATSQPRRLSEEDIAWICENYGVITQTKMAEKLGVNQATISYHLRRNNKIQSRSKSACAVRANSQRPAEKIALMSGYPERTIRANACYENISLANVRRRWTAAEEQYLRDNYPQKSIYEMAKHLGKAKNTVRTHLKVMGLYMTQSELKDK